MKLIIRLFVLLAIPSILAGCAKDDLTITSPASADAGLTTASASRRGDPPVILDISAAERALNSYRKKYTLNPLKSHPLLIKAALAHAKDLANRNKKISHYGSDGSDPSQRLTRAGYKWSNVGENVSAGRNSIAEVIKAWHNSPSHRRNLQKTGIVHFGLAVAHNPRSTYSNYWVLLVAAPAKNPGLNMNIRRQSTSGPY